MIFFEKFVLYLNYFFARVAPFNQLRIFFLGKVRYAQIGKGCYLGPNVTLTPQGGDYFENTQCNKSKLLIIGDRVGTGPNVSFICSSHPEHSLKLLRIYPGKMTPIIVENDVWIGAGAIILPGITVHECSIIGAGAVVTKDVPSYTVVAGVPAHVIYTLNQNE